MDVARALGMAGHAWQAVSSPDAERAARPDDDWAAAVLIADDDFDGALALASSLRAETPDTPLLAVVGEDGLTSFAEHLGVFDDFCAQPLRPEELVVRLRRIIKPSVDAAGDDPGGLVIYGPLQINPVTYQAMIDGDPLDLTYMEYELLKYFAEHPGRVCTREVLLSQVWGYEYYGGARTVDVHVRRLRAKLGEPHAGLIATVRSVGYRFGKSQWV